MTVEGSTWGGWSLLLPTLYFLASPPALALLVVVVVRRRVAGQRDDPKVSIRRYGRWLGLPWVLYLVNLLGAGAYLASGGLDEAGDLDYVGAGLLVLVVALLPMFFLARVMRLWERAFGHPGGRVGFGVEARAWLAYVGFFVVCLGSGLTALSLVGPVAAILVASVTTAAYLVVYPELFRWIWRAYPMPDGPQARRLLDLLADNDAPVRGVLVLPASEGAAANGFVSGVFDSRRYLFLTQPLLEGFAPDEVDAVVAHEIGHLRYHHVPRTAAVMLVAAATVALVLGGAASLMLGEASDAVRTPVFGVVGALIGLSSLLAARRVGRRYEIEADDFATGVLGSGAPMARALRKLARANWLNEEGLVAGAFASHPTIQWRLQRLDSAGGDRNSGSSRAP